MPRKMRDSGIEWIGQVPEGWRTCRFKNAVRIYNGCSIPDTEKEKYAECANAYPYLSSKDIDVTLSIADYANGMYTKKSDGSFKIAPAGSTLMCIEGGSAGRKKVMVREDVSFVNKLACFTAVQCDNRFLHYFLQSPNYEEEFARHLSGLIGGVSVSDLKNIAFCLPSNGEQFAIANYLESKCSIVNSLIQAARKSIEDYKALKQALIVDKVFGGLSACEKRTVDEEWCLPIPSHWDYKQIRYLFALRDERNEKPLLEVNLISLYTDKGVVQHCDLEKTTGNKASTADGYKLVYADDIVDNIILCWMGAVGRSAFTGVTSPAYDVYRPIENAGVLSRYYHYLFRTGRFNGKCYQEGRGIMMMRWRTYSSEFRAIKVPVPPLEEQRAIADYLDAKCGAIDALVAEKESLIADLEQYKKSLIFEVVTGKREVA